MSGSRAPWRSTWLIAVGLIALPAARVEAQSGSTATGTSNKLNPAISLNSLFSARKSDAASDEDGFRAQEFEMGLVSIVDAHFRASANIAFAPSAGGAEAEVGLEEGYVTVLGLPTGLGLKAGRFFLPVGRHNQLHTHQFPFIDAPRAVAATLGGESAGDVGLLASYLPDLPWYLDLQAYVTDAAAEAFDSASRRVSAGGRLVSLFDLGETATFEAGGSFLRGPGVAAGDATFLGADLRLKWRDTRKTYGHAVTWVSEFLLAQSDQPDVSGAYSTLLFRVGRQWWTGVEYSWNSLLPETGRARSKEHEARVQLAWVPSEFSALRGEFGWTDPLGGPRELSATLQLNFTIGAHPAHQY